MQQVHKQRIILIILAAIGAIGTFLPWLKTADSSVIGIKTTGYYSWIALIALVATIVLCTYGEKEKPLTGFLQYIAAGLCALAAVLGILKVLAIVGIGLILLQICSIGGVFIALNISRKKNDGLNEVKTIPNKQTNNNENYI